MENFEKTRINVCLKQSFELSAVLSRLNGTLDLNSATQLFSPKEKFEEVQQNTSDKKKVSFSQEAFREIYKNMGEEEKRLYRIWQISVEPQSDVDKVLEVLNNDQDIEFAAIDELNELYQQPNDQFFPFMYGLDKIEAVCGWNFSKGEGITVAVLDTGVDYRHPDITANMWRNSNGHYGYDFSNNNPNPFDYNGHGSHVAGTIAAVGNNKKGIIGVAPKAKIMAVKIFPNAYDSVISKALKYAVDNGAQVLNNSWGPGVRRPSSPVIESAVSYVHSKGGICVFAAGNKNDDVQYYSPANSPHTLAVACTDDKDQRASYSNYGSKIDLAAPGHRIISLRHNSSSYTVMDGTSMAAPHVSGAVALLLSKAPHLDVARIRWILKKSADKIHTDKSVGAGRLNVCQMQCTVPSIRVHRHSFITTDFGLFSVNENGKLIWFRYDNKWLSSVVPSFGAPIVPSSLIPLTKGFLAGVNENGKMFATWGSRQDIKFAIIEETEALIPGTLRYSESRDCIFALNYFGDFVYIKYHKNQWTSSVIKTWGSPIIPDSVDLYGDKKNLIGGITEAGVPGLTWEDASQSPAPDGTRLGYAQVTNATDLVV